MNKMENIKKFLKNDVRFESFDKKDMELDISKKCSTLIIKNDNFFNVFNPSITILPEKGFNNCSVVEIKFYQEFNISKEITLLVYPQQFECFVIRDTNDLNSCLFELNKVMSEIVFKNFIFKIRELSKDKHVTIFDYLTYSFDLIYAGEYYLDSKHAAELDYMRILSYACDMR